MRSAVLAMLPFLLVGCIEYDLEQADGVDVFTQKPADAVDILLVVDNSCSMQPYQERLGESFDSFISYFIGANVDYHIGVTTTDPGWDDPVSSAACPNPDDPAAGKILGEVITPESADPAGTFRDIVNVGTCGSGFEMGLESAKMALSEPVISNANAGFLRDDASLSIIFVSDEEDSSPEPVNDYINEFFQIKGQRARDVFNASALTVTDEGVCTRDQALASSPGDRYVDVASQTAGVIGNLCEQDFAPIVTDLSLNASRLTDTFYLSDEPDAATITVSVDDVDLPCEDGAWAYERVQLDDEEVPAVVFDRDHLPAPDQRIAIRYYFGDGRVDPFCGGAQ